VLNIRVGYYRTVWMLLNGGAAASSNLHTLVQYVEWVDRHLNETCGYQWFTSTVLALHSDIRCCRPTFFKFEILHESAKSRARVGRITTPHGVVNTPGFVPVGTNGAIKGVTMEAADSAGCELMFMNA
jgi:tricorn protease-like protein